MRRDWGCITLERKGVWRIRYWAMTPAGYRRCSTTVRGTRKEAGDRLAELRLAHGHDAPCPTVAECYERWFLPDRTRMMEQDDLARQTLEQYCGTWRCHVGPRWGQVSCAEVRPLDVQQWLLGLGRSAAEASLHLLRQIMDYATRYGFVDSNPLALRYLMPSASTIARREDGIWTAEELGDVWEACLGSWVEPAVLLCGFGGCRVGEALGVQVGDVRLETIESVPIAFVRIERQIDSRGRKSERTKNRWSTRTVLVAGRPATRIASLAAGRGDEVDCDDGGNVYLTRAPGKEFATQKQLRQTFATLLEEAGVPKHLFKNLRKSWQTNARWVLGLSPWVVEPLMGHAGGGVTGRYYDKPTEKDVARVLAKAWRNEPFADRYAWLESRLG